MSSRSKYAKRYVDKDGILREFTGHKVPKPRLKPQQKTIANKVCALISEGYSLAWIIENHGHKKGWPGTSKTWYDWLRKDEDLQEAYNLAQEDRSETYVDKIIRVVEAVEQGNAAVDIGKFVTDNLWKIAEKHKPRRYAPKTKTSETSVDDGKVTVEFNMIMGNTPQPRQIKADVVEITHEESEG